MTSSTQRMLSVAFSLSALTTHTSVAATDTDIIIVPTLNAGYYGFDYDSPQFGSLSVMPLFYSAGVALVHPGITVNLQYLGTDEDDDYLNSALENTEYSRKQTELAVLIPIINNFSVIAGYTYSESEVVSHTLLSNIGAGSGDYQQDWEEKGLFLGGAYQFSFAKGNLTASLAYAALDVTIEDELSIAGSELEVLGDATGISLGLKWVSLITENLGYSATITIRQYDLDASTISSAPALPGVGAISRDSFDADWDSQIYSAGLFYVF